MVRVIGVSLTGEEFMGCGSNKEWELMESFACDQSGILMVAT